MKQEDIMSKWLKKSMSTYLAKYLKINGEVSKDKWQSMFRYFAKYLKTMSFPDFTRHFFSSLAETLDSVVKAIRKH